MKVVGYCAPWDYLDDPGAAQRARDVGVNVVALAASYHASRIASPLHPSRRVMEIAQSALYLPVRQDVWRGHRLIPQQPSWTKETDLFGSARQQLIGEGLDVDAWVVLTHNDDLGQGNPDLVARNAYGESYSYALCPSAPDVRDYCLTLVREVTAMTNGGLVLEAWGHMGVDHASQHDKIDFASWSATSKQLLSLCFCHACRDGIVDAGIDVDEFARQVRSGVDDGASSVCDALGEDLTTAVLSLRNRQARQLRDDLVETIRSQRSEAAITLHTSASDWATGSFPALGEVDKPMGVTTVVANCWNPSTSENELSSLHALVDGSCGIGGYVRLDQGWSYQEQVADRIGHYGDAGMTEAHLYHLGLLSQVGIDAAARVANAAATNDHGARS